MIHKAAIELIERGISVIPLHRGSKIVAVEGYQDLRITKKQISQYFGSNHDLGFLCGTPSRGIVDVDVDAPDAHPFADQLLPPTKWIFGRDSDPRSHWLYRVSDTARTIQFQDPRRKDMLIELRSNKVMTRLPPSQHESGEILRWDRFESPAEISGNLLLRHVHMVAIGTLLSRYWPEQGSRQNATLALAGGLARANWQYEHVQTLVETIVHNTECEDQNELGRRLSAVQQTYEKITDALVHGEQPTTGWPTLSSIVGEDIVAAILEWLGIASKSSSGKSGQRSRNVIEDCPKDIIANISSPRTLTSWQDSQNLIGSVEWLWTKWLPKGFLTMLVAQSGEGKSALAMHIGNVVATGGYWPDGQPFDGETGGVLWCEAEAGQAMHQQRAIQWSIRYDRFYYPLEDPMQDIRLNVPDHRELIAGSAANPEIKLVIVDSLRGAVPGDENSSEMIQYTKWLAELARDTGKPVLLLHHINKPKGDRREVTLERVRGNSALVQLTRVVWAIDQPNNSRSNVKRLRVIKNNLESFPNSLGITIDECGVSFNDTPTAGPKETQVDRAARVLDDLDFSEPISVEEISSKLRDEGISMDSGKRAKDRLGIESRKIRGQWFWTREQSGGL